MSNGAEHIPEASTLDGATTEPEPGVESTPGEFAVIWNRRTEEQRAEMLRNMRSAVHRSNRCILEDHDARLAKGQSPSHTRTPKEGGLTCSSA